MDRNGQKAVCVEFIRADCRRSADKAVIGAYGRRASWCSMRISRASLVQLFRFSPESSMLMSCGGDLERVLVGNTTGDVAYLRPAREVTSCMTDDELNEHELPTKLAFLEHVLI